MYLKPSDAILSEVAKNYSLSLFKQTAVEKVKVITISLYPGARRWEELPFNSSQVPRLLCKTK